MAFIIEATCLCNTGKVRKNNEDNYFFNGKCMPEFNEGLKKPVSMSFRLGSNTCMALFDGMGGENYGEAASFAAADEMRIIEQRSRRLLLSKNRLVKAMCYEMNDAVLRRAKSLRTSYMGTTMVSLLFSRRCVHCFNLGDSRAYCLHNGDLSQLSKDHIDHQEGRKKAPLTQFLGIEPDDFYIEPHISKRKLHKGDRYLLCSDGLTDMLNDREIVEIMKKTETARKCAQALVNTALEHGGKDNVTVIVCKVC